MDVIIREHLILKKGLLLLLCLSGLYTCAFASSSSPHEQLFMVGNVHAPDCIKHEELKQIFLGQKTRWQDDSRISFALFAEEPGYKAFLRTYIGKTPSQYKNYWKKQVFSGKGRMPKYFTNSQNILEFLTATEGAICFLTHVPADLKNIKLIRIE